MKIAPLFALIPWIALSFTALAAEETSEFPPMQVAPPFQRSVSGVALPIVAMADGVDPSASAIWSVQIFDPTEKLVGDAYLYSKKKGEKSQPIDLSLAAEQPKKTGFYTIVWKGKTSLATRLGDVHFNGEVFQTDVRKWDPEDEVRLTVLFESKSIKR